MCTVSSYSTAGVVKDAGTVAHRWPRLVSKYCTVPGTSTLSNWYISELQVKSSSTIEVLSEELVSFLFGSKASHINASHHWGHWCLVVDCLGWKLHHNTPYCNNMNLFLANYYSTTADASQSVRYFQAHQYTVLWYPFTCILQPTTVRGSSVHRWRGQD